MDKETQMENIQKELKAAKGKDPKTYDEYKKRVGKYMEDHKEFFSGVDEQLSNEFQLTLMYSYIMAGPENTEKTLSDHFTPYKGNFAKLVKGTTKDPSISVKFLNLKLTAGVERVQLSHHVYVLGRSTIRDNVEFQNDEPDPVTGKMPEHKTMSVTLWDNDARKIIPLFLVDAQVDAHSMLETDHAYKMQIGNYDSAKDRWYASKDPSIVALNGESFEPDWLALAEFILENYTQIKEPYEEIIKDSKENPRKRYAIQCNYVKKPSHIELVPNENTEYSISLPFSSLTASLSSSGEAIIVGSFQKSKPKQGQVQLSDYVIFPDLILNLTPDGEVNKVASSKDTEKNTQEENNGKDELDGIL